MGKFGVKTRCNTKVESVGKDGRYDRLKVSSDGKTDTIEAQKVMVAISVRPNTENLGLEALGVQMTKGAIDVNDQMQTNVPGVYAIGDVTMKLGLAHVASAQGIIATEAMAGQEPRALDLNNVPRCTYCSPPGRVAGVSPRRRPKRRVTTYESASSRFAPMAKRWASMITMGSSSSWSIRNMAKSWAST